MAYRFTLEESVPDNVRRIARERLDEAVECLTAALDGQDVHENVHTARKRNKHVRAVTRLVRVSAPDIHDRENPAVRDAARQLAPLRDATAVLETLELLDDLADEDAGEALATVRERLEEDRAEQLSGDATGEAIRTARDGFAAVAARVPDWEVDDSFDALAGGLAKTYKRARNRLDDVVEQPTTERLHEWRKRVKYHRYHIRLLRDAWHPVLQARRDETHRLSDLLGDDHDLAVLRGRIAEHDDRPTQVVIALIDRRRAWLQRAAVPLGNRLFVEEPAAHVARIRAAWDAWHDEARIDPTDPAPALAAAGG